MSITSSVTGIGFLVTASIVNTNFALLMKRNRRWSWENTWLAWALLALVLLPVLLTLATVPGLDVIYGKHGAAAVRVIWLGAAWGLSQIFFGMAVATAGIAVSFATILGISAVIGSLVPLSNHPHVLMTSAGFVLLAGVTAMLGGVGVCAMAGRLRDAARQQCGPVTTRGLIYCLLAGLGSGVMNLALVSGASLSVEAANRGASPTWAQNAIWLPFMVSGALPNIAYCLRLMRRNRTGARYLDQPVRHWPLALGMAACWLGSVVLYGVGTTRMGPWGPVFAWPVYMSLIVISGTVAGVLTGEWELPTRTPVQRMAQGVLLLVVAVFLLAGAGAKL